MKKILVPCDFSKPAINAFRIALDIAHRSKGTVHLLNVIEVPVVMSDPALMPGINFEGQLVNELNERANAEFRRMITKYKPNEVKVVSEVQLGGVASAILDYVSDRSIDLVLMGSHGASGLQEFFVGSNAEKIVRRSPVPVLIVKDYYKGPIKNMVFPNNLQLEDQEDLVEKVKGLQSFLKATLHILWINTPLNFAADILTEERFDAFVRTYKITNYTTNIFNHNNEEDGILLFSKSIKGDLIVMGTHGRRGLSHVVNGSLAENVVNHSDKLVWTYTLKNQPVEA
jgi:nucleotide-binding universal stress UspA family protein